jgi:hypothetical protein
MAGIAANKRMEGTEHASSAAAVWRKSVIVVVTKVEKIPVAGSLVTIWPDT